MGFYEEWILPTLIDLSMRNKRLRPYRERVAGAAEGRVLDVGIGPGRLPGQERCLVAMLRHATRRCARTKNSLNRL
jgi:hypothetical protein